MRPKLQHSNWHYINLEKKLNGEKNITHDEQSREDRPAEDAEVGQQEDRIERRSRLERRYSYSREGLDPNGLPMVRLNNLSGSQSGDTNREDH